MNMNDSRYPIKHSDIFDKDGFFKIDADGVEVGKELLIRKSTGYISYIRGDNPYSFPFKIWPNMFLREKSIKSIAYPSKQMNGDNIDIGLELLDIYATNIGKYQEKAYERILNTLGNDGGGIDMGYQMLEKPIQILNFAYPSFKLDDGEDLNDRDLYGKAGLENTMNIKNLGEVSYKKKYLDKYGRFFSSKHIGKYSAKIKEICDNIKTSKGIALIYSQYIGGGCIPIALALEEMGYRRYGGRNFFKNAPVKKSIGNYVMITGDNRISPNNANEINMATSSDNINGEKVKIIIISKAGSEGLDFKNIRQIHILEPWYNTNRLEQIIGRGVRTCSHKDLSLKERNVEIYMYGTLLSKNMESADLYVYRVAEKKAIHIGRVARVLKENSIDCILNAGQSNFTEKEMDQKLQIELASNKKITYAIGDKPYSTICDYMENCNYKCNNKCNIGSINQDTNTEHFMILNIDRIMSKIKDLFKEHYVYHLDEIVSRVNYKKIYPMEQINMALENLIDDNSEFITDMLGRLGRLIAVNDVYLFQPKEIDRTDVPLYERNRPLDVKRKKIVLTFKNTPDQKKRNRNIDTITEYISNSYETIVDGGNDKTWASRVNKVIEGMTFNKEDLRYYALFHLIDTLNYDDKLKLANYMFSKKRPTKFENKIIDIFKLSIIDDSLILADKGALQMFKFSGKWKPLTELEKMNMDEKLLERKSEIKDKLNSVFGVLDTLKGELVFKLKNSETVKGIKLGKRGMVCKQITKRNVISNLNKIIGRDKYNMENTKIIKGEGKSAIDLCIEQELLLIHYTKTKKNKKIWFLSSIDTILCKN